MAKNSGAIYVSLSMANRKMPNEPSSNQISHCALDWVVFNFNSHARKTSKVSTHKPRFKKVKPAMGLI